MRNIYLAPLAALSLTACASLGSSVKPQRPNIEATKPDGNNPLKLELYNDLLNAKGQQNHYAHFRGRLETEQTVRNVAIIGSAIGLSAATVFRGDKNSLKTAGFITGLTTFVDKAIPLNGRIAAARSAVDNYNNLLATGNEILKRNVDEDNKDLNNYINKIDNDVRAAQSIDRKPESVGCGRNESTDACAERKSGAILKAQKNTSDLDAAIKAAQAAQATAKAAKDALESLHGAIRHTDLKINEKAASGVAVVVDSSVISAGVKVVTASMPKEFTSSPQNVCPAPMSNIEEAIAKLKQDVQEVKDFTASVDYVALLAEVKAEAPGADPPAKTPGKATTGNSGA
jgi:hypothetical protein